MLHSYTITFECGHSISYSMAPAAAPQVGDVLYCYDCGQERRVDSVVDRGEILEGH